MGRNPDLAPGGKQEGTLQHKATLILRAAQAVKQALQGIAHQHQIVRLLLAMGQVQQPVMHRVAQVTDFLHTRLSRYGRITLVIRQMVAKRQR